MQLKIKPKKLYKTPDLTLPNSNYLVPYGKFRKFPQADLALSAPNRRHVMSRLIDLATWISNRRQANTSTSENENQPGKIPKYRKTEIKAPQATTPSPRHLVPCLKLQGSQEAGRRSPSVKQHGNTQVPGPGPAQWRRDTRRLSAGLPKPKVHDEEHCSEDYNEVDSKYRDVKVDRVGPET